MTNVSPSESESDPLLDSGDSDVSEDSDGNLSRRSPRSAVVNPGAPGGGTITSIVPPFGGALALALACGGAVAPAFGGGTLAALAAPAFGGSAPAVGAAALAAPAFGGGAPAVGGGALAACGGGARRPKAKALPRAAAKVGFGVVFGFGAMWIGAVEHVQGEGRRRTR